VLPLKGGMSFAWPLSRRLDEEEDDEEEEDDFP
jgi:hypothetical protein